MRSGRRYWAIGTSALVVVATALVLSSIAEAHRTGLLGEVQVKASNGYEVFIDAVRWKHPRKPGKIFVTAENLDTFSSWSTYEARARLTRHHLKANLGAFGRISLRYRPARGSQLAARAKAPEPGALFTKLNQQFNRCAVSIDGSTGRFKGRIRFRGEDGYTRVRAHKAHGFISPTTESCSDVKPQHGVALDAGSGSVRFEADRLRGSKHALYLAKEKESAGRVAIARMALDGGPRSSFIYGVNPDRAHVAPGGETMTGSARLTPAGQWTGSLAVNFPGDPDVPLAGPEFSAQLGHF